jgi:chromosome segregation ATPase
VSLSAGDGLAIGFSLHAKGREAMEATSNPSQISELEQQMQQADTDWEALTRSIQANKQALLILEERLDNFRLLLSLPPHESSDEASALAAQLELLKQQIVSLDQRIRAQQMRRNAIERQFDQARLARAALRRALQKPSSRFALARKLLVCCVKRPLHGFWAYLTRPEHYGEIMPPDDASLHRHASTGGQ